MEESTALEPQITSPHRWIFASGAIALLALTLLWIAANRNRTKVFRAESAAVMPQEKADDPPARVAWSRIPEPGTAPVAEFREAAPAPKTNDAEIQPIMVVKKAAAPKVVAAPGDPDAALFTELGVSLDHAAKALAGLASEYRTLLGAGDSAPSEATQRRMDLLDKAMAAIVVKQKHGAEEALALLAREESPAMAMYLGRLLRQARENDTRLAIETIACTDPLPARRAGALAAIAPAADAALIPFLEHTLSDPDRDVRLEAAHLMFEAVKEGLHTRPPDWLSTRARTEDDAEVRSILKQGLDLLRKAN